MAQVEEEDHESDEVEDDHEGVVEELAAHVVEVGLDAALGHGLLEHLALAVVEVANPLAVLAELALGDEVGHGDGVAQAGDVGLYLGLLLFGELVGIHGHLVFDAGHHVGGRHLVLHGVLHQGVDLLGLQFLHLDHVFAFDPADFDEVELAEVYHQEGEDEDAGPHHEFGARVGFGALALLVARGSGQTVGDDEPKRQQDVQRDDAEEDDFEDLHHPVGAHEVAEGGVPGAVVVAQDEEVGRHVEQQEEQQEGAHAGDEHLLCDGVDLG